MESLANTVVLLLVGALASGATIGALVAHLAGLRGWARVAAVVAGAVGAWLLLVTR